MSEALGYTIWLAREGEAPYLRIRSSRSYVEGPSRIFEVADGKRVVVPVGAAIEIDLRPAVVEELTPV